MLEKSITFISFSYRNYGKSYLELLFLDKIKKNGISLEITIDFPERNNRNFFATGSTVLGMPRRKKERKDRGGKTRQSKLRR